ncbi:MAG TPA: hypothetical protein VH109_02665 [Steroidobacteraceae bacterium]|nr:hypothetical protein [Steroidobacteraceae bacterium]
MAFMTAAALALLSTSPKGPTEKHAAGSGAGGGAATARTSCGSSSISFTVGSCAIDPLLGAGGTSTKCAHAK